MEELISKLSYLTPYIIIGMSTLILILCISMIILFKKISKLQKKYKKLMQGTKGKNLEQVIIDKLDSVEEIKLKTEALNKQYLKVEDEMKKCIQKVAIMRYRAFDNVGSDLSFSIAMLDAENNGIMLTGIYGREDSTTYAKPIDRGVSRYNLSEEEECVLNEACQQIKGTKKTVKKTKHLEKML